jgi:hypothetical protein
MTNAPFNPLDIGFFLRADSLYPPDIEYYELDHPNIDKSLQKDWKRMNVFLSKDGDFVTIWTGPVDIGIASGVYEEQYGFELKVEQHIENYFRGYIRNKMEGEIIWNAINLKGFRPYYLGEPDPWLNHFDKK